MAVLMWVVAVRWRRKGHWERVETCHGIEVAVALVDEYREDGHAARVEPIRENER